MYTNGPGFNYTVNLANYTAERHNITTDDVKSYDYVQLSAVYMESETHGGEDVAIYATGKKTFS